MLSSFNYYTDGFDGPSNAWTLAAGLIRPASRGEIRLLSNESALVSAFAPAHGFGFGKNRLKNRKIPQERTAGAVSVLLRQDV